jgi:large subunit ribosomal protein L24
MSGAGTAGKGLSLMPFRYWVRKALLKRIKGAPIEPIRNWHIVKGDMVYVRSGRSAGHIGRVLDVLRGKNRLVVEGANIVKRAVRVEAAGKAGGIVPMPSPLHYSNVNLLDPTLK